MGTNFITRFHKMQNISTFAFLDIDQLDITQITFLRITRDRTKNNNIFIVVVVVVVVGDFLYRRDFSRSKQL